MYADPKRVKYHKIVVRLDDYELDTLKAVAQKTGGHISTTARELAMAAIVRALEGKEESSNLADSEPNTDPTPD